MQPLRGEEESVDYVVLEIFVIGEDFMRHVVELVSRERENVFEDEVLILQQAGEREINVVVYVENEEDHLLV